MLEPPVSLAGAAVTIVLRDGADDEEILLIERTTRPDDPASGQVALPGGHVDDGDGSLRATAVRELEEEVGLTEADLTGPVRFVRTQSAPRFRLEVGVFVGELGPGRRVAPHRNPREVAHVFWFPAHQLRSSDTIHVEHERGAVDLPASRFEGHLLWGFTRRVLRDFYGLTAENDAGGVLYAPSPGSARDPEAGSDSRPAP